MTSPLRRKHRITRPSIGKMRSRAGAECPGGRVSRCLVFGAAVAALLWATGSTIAAADDAPATPTQTKLQWQPYRPSDQLTRIQSAAVHRDTKSCLESKCEAKNCGEQ